MSQIFFVPSLHVLWMLRFPPTVTKQAGQPKVPKGVKASVNGCARIGANSAYKN